MLVLLVLILFNTGASLLFDYIIKESNKDKKQKQSIVPKWIKVLLLIPPIGLVLVLLLIILALLYAGYEVIFKEYFKD